MKKFMLWCAVLFIPAAAMGENAQKQAIAVREQYLIQRHRDLNNEWKTFMRDASTLLIEDFRDYEIGLRLSPGDHEWHQPFIAQTAHGAAIIEYLIRKQDLGTLENARKTANLKFIKTRKILRKREQELGEMEFPEDRQFFLNHLSESISESRYYNNEALKAEARVAAAEYVLLRNNWATPQLAEKPPYRPSSSFDVGLVYKIKKNFDYTRVIDSRTR